MKTISEMTQAERRVALFQDSDLADAQYNRHALLRYKANRVAKGIAARVRATISAGLDQEVWAIY